MWKRCSRRAHGLTHLEAVRSDSLQAFAVRQGYSSPKDRQVTDCDAASARG